MGLWPHASASVPGARPSLSPDIVLRQSSRPPDNLSYLWFMQTDRLATYRDADLIDEECDLANSALNAWATAATVVPVVRSSIGPGEAQAPALSVFSLTNRPDGSLLEVQANTPDGPSMLKEAFPLCFSVLSVMRAFRFSLRLCASARASNPTSRVM